MRTSFSGDSPLFNRPPLLFLQVYSRPNKKKQPLMDDWSTALMHHPGTDCPPVLRPKKRVAPRKQGFSIARDSCVARNKLFAIDSGEHDRRNWRLDKFMLAPRRGSGGRGKPESSLVGRRRLKSRKLHGAASLSCICRRNQILKRSIKRWSRLMAQSGDKPPKKELFVEQVKPVNEN